MATETMRQRTKEESASDVVTDSNNNNTKPQQKRRATMARRGLKTLIAAVAFPAVLHAAMLLSAHSTASTPATWLLHAISLGSGSLMGLCAWLVWAEGGFHKRPMGLGLFLGYLVFSLVWDRVMVGSWPGLVASLGMLGTLAGCCGAFKRVNPIAGDLVKLCLIWAGFSVVLNIKLLCG